MGWLFHQSESMVHRAIVGILALLPSVTALHGLKQRLAGHARARLPAEPEDDDLKPPVFATDYLPDDFLAAAYPPEKLAALAGRAAELRGKHLRVRNLALFLNGCGFFTFPAVVMAQLSPSCWDLPAAERWAAVAMAAVSTAGWAQQDW